MKESATDADLLAGFGASDDAAVYRINDETALVLTVDFFAPVVDDPYDYGYIAAANALSDVYAVGGNPMLALNIACFPRTLGAETTREILRGGSDACGDAGTIIVGGHTVEDDEPKYGLAVIGSVVPGKQVGHHGAEVGDQVVLTKPIGGGIVTTALKAGAADAPVVRNATELMKTLNRDASAAMLVAGANAATDVTGYGLIGHLTNIAQPSGVTIQLRASSVPLMPGAVELLDQGYVSGGTQRNLSDVEELVRWDARISEATRLLMCDAQTSGGLAILLPHFQVDTLLTELRERGIAGAVIGEVVEQTESAISVVA